MNRIKSAIISVFISTLTLSAQSVSLQQVADQMAADPVFSQALAGICVISADGTSIARVNSGKMMVPASNMKLITTGAALHELGGEYRFETSIGYDGEIEEGTLKGNLYIIGGGDPTLGSKDSIAVVLEKTFSQWEHIVRSAGIKEIEGHVVGDGRWMDGMMEEPTWLWNDIGTYYGSGATGLMFYENMQSFSVYPGDEVGKPVRIKPSYPSCPWMDFRYTCTTGKAGTGDMLYMYTSDLYPTAEIRGTFGIDRGSKRVDCSNKFPEYTCAEYFTIYLRKHGIGCAEGSADFKLYTEWEPKGEIRIIGKTSSPSLRRIAFETNHASNNLYAETLFRTLGKERHQSACYDSSRVAIVDVLKNLRIDTTRGHHIQDGSGLSRQNYVSADFMCRFLKAMISSPEFDNFLYSLPVPGGNGSLSYNMKSYPQGLRSRIRVKSGSMNGVRCYSGYILPADFQYIPGQPVPEEVKSRILIFSVLTNNCTSPNWKVRPMLDRFMAEIAKTL